MGCCMGASSCMLADALFTCQVAALFRAKLGHGHRLEIMMLNQKSDYHYFDMHLLT